MRFSQAFRLSTRMFTARTSRTLLTILGMSIGIGAILFLVSLGYGLQKTLLERITTSDTLLTLDVTEAKSGTIILDRDTADQIGSLPGVEHVSPAFQISAQGHVGDLSADMSAVGCSQSFLSLSGSRMTAGKPFDDGDPNAVVVSTSVAEVFGKKPEEMIGEQIRFSFFVPRTEETGGAEDRSGSDEAISVDGTNVYTVVGIIDGEDHVAYINVASLGDLNIGRYGQLKVKCRTSADLLSVRNQIFDKGLLVSSLSETVDQANQIFGILQIILMFFGIIALVVSAIGMFNTMTIALLERTEEIGIMKSIGASDREISFLFFMESAIMGLFGGLSGVMIGWLGGAGFNVLINYVSLRFGGQAVSLFYSPSWFVLLIILFSAVVGLLTGFAPARRASKIDPLDALRYK